MPPQTRYEIEKPHPAAFTWCTSVLRENKLLLRVGFLKGKERRLPFIPCAQDDSFCSGDPLSRRNTVVTRERIAVESSGFRAVLICKLRVYYCCRGVIFRPLWKRHACTCIVQTRAFTYVRFNAKSVSSNLNCYPYNVCDNTRAIIFHRKILWNVLPHVIFIHTMKRKIQQIMRSRLFQSRLNRDAKSRIWWKCTTITTGIFNFELSVIFPEKNIYCYK